MKRNKNIIKLLRNIFFELIIDKDLYQESNEELNLDGEENSFYHSSECPMGMIYCIETNTCIYDDDEIDDEMWGEEQICPPGKFYCLQSSR